MRRNEWNLLTLVLAATLTMTAKGGKRTPVLLHQVDVPRDRSLLADCPGSGGDVIVQRILWKSF